MRRLVLMTGTVLVICHLVLGGIVLAGRLNDGVACLQYRTYNATDPVFGVIDANTGMALIDRGRGDWTYLYTGERYSLVAKQRDTGYNAELDTPYTSYDLALTSSDPFLTEPRTYTLLQEALIIPIASNQFASSLLYQFISTSLITTPGQLAFRWLDTTLHGYLTLVNEDGSNRRVVELDPLTGLSSPIAWSADARYILLRMEQSNRFKPYAVLDVQTLKPVSLPTELYFPDTANWQTAVWSPTHSQLAAIRPAKRESDNHEAFDKPVFISPLQLVLYSPADGTTHILDLPPQFYAQEVMWSPSGQFGMVVGIYIPGADGRSTQQDAKGYVLFTAAGELKSGILQGIHRAQLGDLYNIRLGLWTVDGRTWLYLRESSDDPTNFFELVAVNAETMAEQVIETRLMPAWWAEVFVDRSSAGVPMSAMPPTFRRDVVLVTVDKEYRLNMDLLDTHTMQRTRLVTGADRLTSPQGQMSAGGESAFRLTLYHRNQPSFMLFDAVVEHGTKSTLVWGTLDGSNRREMPLDNEFFEISNWWAFQQSALLYRLQRGNQWSIGKIDIATGAQTDLITALPLVDRFQSIYLPDADRIAFTVTSVASGPSDLYLSSLDGNLSKALATQILPDPVWLADGSQLAYMTANNGRFKVSFVDKDGTLLREVTTNIKLKQQFQGIYLRAWTKCPE